MAVSTIPQPVKPLVDSLGARVGNLETGATGLGTRVGNLETVINNFLIDGSLPGSAGFHNSIFRGKSLGGSVTEAQYAAIGAGTFDGLFIGDYWTINNVNWRIAAFDYWLNHGDEGHVCQTHHAVIVPDTCLATSCEMNSTDITTGGYVGSDYYTASNSNTGKATAGAAITGAFGAEHILTHRELLTNAITDNLASAWSWYDCMFELMNENMVFGSSRGGGRPQIGINYNIGNSNAQFQLFVFSPNYISIQAPYWTRDINNEHNFTNVNAGGEGNAVGASDTTVGGIRPEFAIKA